MLSHVPLLETPWTVAHKAPLFPDKNAGVGDHFLLQEISQPRDQTRIFSWQVNSLPLFHLGSSEDIEYQT